MSDTDLSRGSEASREIDFANWRLAMHIKKKKKFKASSYTLIQKSNFVQKYIYTGSFYGDLLPIYRLGWVEFYRYLKFKVEKYTFCTKIGLFT